MATHNFRIGITHKGSFDPAVTYYTNQEVLYDGSTYRRIGADNEATTGIDPTDASKWTRVSRGLSQAEIDALSINIGVPVNTSLSWTFATNATAMAGYTGNSGTQTMTSGGLADNNLADSGASAFYSTNNISEKYLTADFGAVVGVSTVRIGNINGLSGEILNGARVQSSSDGTNWTTHTTLSGYGTAPTMQSVYLYANGSPRQCRYVRLWKPAAAAAFRLGCGEFKFS